MTTRSAKIYSFVCICMAVLTACGGDTNRATGNNGGNGGSPEADATMTLHQEGDVVTVVLTGDMIRRVDFFLNEEATAFASNSTPPFTATLRTVGLPAGEHLIRAAIVIDFLGEESTIARTRAFSVRDDGTPEPVASEFPLALELEEFSVISSFQVLRDTAASAGAALVHPAGVADTTDPSVEASRKFSVIEADTYYFYVRILAPNSTSDLFYVGFDGALAQRNPPAPGASYQWLLGAEQALSAGEHALDVGRGESGMRLDAAVVSRAPMSSAELDTLMGVEGGITPVPEPPITSLLGVGSSSTSLTEYPKIQNTTAGDWYVDASVSSSGNGRTLAAAFKTIEEGLAALQSGQTLLVKGGTTYIHPNRINRTTAWDKETRIMGYGDDRPVISGIGFTTSQDALLRFQAQSKNETWHRFYIRDVANGNGVMIASDNTTLSDIWISHVHVDGISVAQGNGNVTIKDCVVWRLGDGSSQGTDTGDCFAVTAWTEGINTQANIVRCVGINGQDDGFDLWGGRLCNIIDSVAINTGRYWTGNPAGDGNGFKLGGGSAGGKGFGKNNTIRGSIAIGSRSAGIVHNHSASTSDMTIINNTTYNNGGTGVDYGQNSTTWNNISSGDGSTNYPEPGPQDLRNNSWQLGITDPQFAKVSENDFSLASGSPAIGAGYEGVNLGASVVALELAKTWAARDVTGYAKPEWE